MTEELLEYNKRRCLKRNNKAYTREEAENLGIEWKMWYDPSSKIGDWVLTDDGFVVQIVNIREYCNNKGYKSTIVNTVLGSYTFENHKKFNVGHYFYSRTNIGRGNIRYSYKLSERDKQILKFVAEGLDPKIIFSIFYKDGSKSYRWRLKKIFCKEGAIEYMSNLVKEKLNQAGLTEDWWFRQLKLKAEEARDDVAWEVLKVIGYMHSLIEPPHKTKLQEEHTIYLDNDSLERLNQVETLEISENAQA